MKRVGIFSAIVATALLIPAGVAKADHWHHRHHHSGVSVSIGGGSYYGPYYYDSYSYGPYYHRSYYAYPAPVYYNAYPAPVPYYDYPYYGGYVYYSRPSFGIRVGW